MTWHEIEALRQEQEYRTLHARLGDAYADLAWLHVHKLRTRCRYRKAVALLVKACDQYQLAGLSRRSQSAWRYARLLHRADGRAA